MFRAPPQCWGATSAHGRLPTPAALHQEATDKVTRSACVPGMTRSPGGRRKAGLKCLSCREMTEWFLQCSEGKKMGTNTTESRKLSFKYEDDRQFGLIGASGTRGSYQMKWSYNQETYKE